MMKEKDLVLPLKPVLKLASDKEVETYIEQKLEAEEAFKICKEKISKHQLEMKLITSEYTFDKSKLIFYFTANGRIDFRELVKDLALIFRTRIELRQIGVRDEARILGNIGPCGKELCCKTFINRFDSVSVKMARDQGLVINPTKISGVCGRLLCCINYEYAQYEEALKDFPAVNQSVGTQMGEGKVVSISPLNGFLYIDVQDKGISRFNIEDIKFNRKEASILKNMKASEAMFELAKLLENKYPDFKYKKSQKYLEKKTKKYSYLIAFFSFYWNTKENVALDVCFIANNIESASQAFYKSLWKEWIYYNVSTNELILEVFENICKHIETDFLVEIEKLEK